MCIAILVAACGGSVGATPSATASPEAALGCRATSSPPPATSTVKATTGAVGRYAVGGGPTGLIFGPDHNLWFSDTDGSRIGRLTLDGTLSSWDVGGGMPGFLAAGLDGSIWAPEEATGSVVRIVPDGRVLECPLPTHTSAPFGVTVGPDGNVWVAEKDAARVARMSPDGVANEFAVPGGGSPVYITIGPDMNLWFTEGSGGRIGRVTTTGAITTFPLPSSQGGQGAMTIGPDGAIWFTEFTLGRIGRITTSGQVKEFPLPAGSASKPNGIVAGPDGALWFAESGSNMIGRITVDGKIAQREPVSGFPDQLVFTPDGSLWVTTYQTGEVVRIAKP